MSTVSSTDSTTYRDWNSSSTKATDKKGNTYNAVFVDEENTDLGLTDFLNLMVTQLKNQDFTNPVDNSEFLAQMAQFASLQQMQELAEYSQTNYAMSLVGKNVTAAKYTVSGSLDKTTGVITKVSLVDNEYKIFIGDKSYSLSQIMEVNYTEPPSKPDEDDKDKDKDKDKEVDPSGSTDSAGDKSSTDPSGKTDGADSTDPSETPDGADSTDPSGTPDGAASSDIGGDSGSTSDTAEPSGEGTTI